MESSTLVVIQASAHVELEAWLSGLGCSRSAVVHDLLRLGAATPHDVLLLEKEEIESLPSVQNLPLISKRKLINALEQMRQDGELPGYGYHPRILASAPVTTAAALEPPCLENEAGVDEHGLDATWDALFGKGRQEADQHGVTTSCPPPPHGFEESAIPLCDVLGSLCMGKYLALLQDHQFNVKACALVDADILYQFGIPIVDGKRLVSTARELLGHTPNAHGGART